MRHLVRWRLTALGAGVLALLAIAPPAWGWGSNGHRITAQIAEDRLSAPARERVRALIGDQHLAQIANWPDFIRSEPGWKFLDSWHYATVEDGEDFAEVLARDAKTPTPDEVVEAIEFFASILRGDGAKAQLFRDLMAKNGVEPLAGSLEATALSFVVHLVGDVHQPLHVGRGGDRGGNNVAVDWFDEQSNLHSLWDSGLIDHEKLSFTEYADFLERELGATAGQWRGSKPADWAEESIRARGQVYEIWQRTSRTNFLPDLGWNYAHDNIGLVNRRLFQGGVRLAELLDSIFGGTAPARH